MSQASYGADAVQALIRQRLLDQIAEQERKRRAMSDDREFNLRQQEMDERRQEREQDRQDRLMAGQAAGADRAESRLHQLAGNIVQETAPGTSLDKPIAGVLRAAGRGSLVKENPEYAFPPMLETGTVRETNIGDQPGDVYQGTNAQQRQIRQDETTAENQRRTDTRLSAQAAETQRHNQAMESRPTGTSPDNEPLVPIVGADGKPVLVRRSDAVGKPPANSREQGRNLVSGDVGRMTDLDTSLNDLDALEVQLGTTGAESKLGAMMPNVVSELTGFGVDAKSRQALINRVKQVIGKALEGGVLRKEDEIKYEKILPAIGDPPEVAQSKLQGLRQAIMQKRETFMTDLDAAGFDVSRYPKEHKRAKKAGKIYARDAKGVLHEADEGTALPAGWTMEP